MITTSVVIELVTSGDGENHVDSFSWPANANAPPPTFIFMTNSGTTTVAVPANAQGCVILAPTVAANTYAVKRQVADTGTIVSPSGVLAFRFSAAGVIPSFILSSTVGGVTWTIYWC